MVPFNDVQRQIAKQIGFAAENAQIVERFFVQLLRFLLGAGESQQGRISRFVVVFILALCLAERRRVALFVKDVVLDLELQTDTFGVLIEFGGDRRINIGFGQRCEIHARPD